MTGHPIKSVTDSAGVPWLVMSDGSAVNLPSGGGGMVAQAFPDESGEPQSRVPVSWMNERHVSSFTGEWQTLSTFDNDRLTFQGVGRAWKTNYNLGGGYTTLYAYSFAGVDADGYNRKALMYGGADRRGGLIRVLWGDDGISLAQVAGWVNFTGANPYFTVFTYQPLSWPGDERISVSFIPAPRQWELGWTWANVKITSVLTEAHADAHYFGMAGCNGTNGWAHSTDTTKLFFTYSSGNQDPYGLTRIRPLQVGDRLLITVGNSDFWVLYSVTGAFTTSASTYTLPVSFVSAKAGGADIANFIRVTPLFKSFLGI